jgi:hypothetical protein
MTLGIYIPNRSEVTEDFYGDCDVLADITPLAVEHQFNDCIAMITTDGRRLIGHQSEFKIIEEDLTGIDFSI